MSLFLAVFLSLLLFLPKTPAKSFSEGMDSLNSDSPQDDLTMTNDDIFATTPSLLDSQDLAITLSNNQMDNSNGLEDESSLDTASLKSEVMPLDSPNISVADHDIMESDCSLNGIEPTVQKRQSTYSNWFSVPDLLPWPLKDKIESGSDVCIPPESEESECKPGEESLCCKGKTGWVDDSMVLVVDGCIRCTSPVISLFITAIFFCHVSLANKIHFEKIRGETIATMTMGLNGVVKHSMR